MQIEKLRAKIDTIAGLCARGKTQVLDSGRIATSFPGFEKQLEKIAI
jgi:5-enolpyruvylshikimate-3-phosphate synthase